MSITTLRPDSTAKNVSVNTSGGASVFSVVDDSPDNDATVAQGGANKAYALLGLTTTTIGATNRVKQARIRARIEHDGVDVGHAEKVNVNLADPTLGVIGPISQFSTATSSAWTAVSAGYTQTPPGGTAWSQAIVDRLQVKLYWIVSVSGTGFVKVSEVYVDLDINAQPVVSAVTVTGATSTTRPSWSFTFTDADGDTQAAYQIRVFSAAQYGAAGFSAGSSTATWDSGAVLGDATAGVIGADLANGTTYKVYARAGQDWPAAQGLGSVWYSEWAASSAFAVTLTPPPAPTLTVSQQTGLPGYRNLIRVAAPINLLTANQASLETDTTGWAASTNCTISRSTAYFVDGAASLQLSSTAGGSMAAATSAAVRVKAGQRVVLVATGRSAVSVRSVRLDVLWYDVAGAPISQITGTPANDATGSDTSWYVTAVAPANAYSAFALINVLATGGAAEVHRFDKFGIFHYPTDPGSAAAAAALWTPGGYAASATVSLYRSQRISKTIARGPARNGVHPQQFSGGALTISTDGFSARQANDSVTFLPMDRAAPEGTGQVSAGMIEWTIRTAAVSFMDIGAPDGTATDGTHPYLLWAVPGKSMTASCWLWADAAFTARLAIVYVDRYNAQVGSTTFSSNASLTTTEQKVTVAATPPAGAVFARLAVENQAGVAGFRVYVAMPRWRVTADPDEAWPGQMFSWETETVRVLTSTSFVDGQHDVVQYDHEPPPGRPILYWARVVAATSTGDSIASLDSTAVHVYNTPPADAVLKDPWQPENAYLCRVLSDGHDLIQDEDAGQFHPLGADGDPVVWRDWLGGVDGRISVFAASDLERYRLDQLHPSARPLLIQWPEGGNTYIRITRRGIHPQLVAYGYWRYDFDYVQVGRP